MHDASGEKTATITYREWLVWVPVIFCLTYISVFGTHMEIVDRRAQYAGDIDRLHNEVISGEAVSPIQYRIGSYWLAEKTRSLYGGSLQRTYQNHRFCFTFLSALLFICFLRRFLKPGWVFGGMAYFFALLPWAYIGYHHQPADPINLFMFMLGFVAIAHNKPWWLIPIVGIGMFNRETVILLPVFDLILNYDKRPICGLVIRTALGIATGLAVYAAIYAYFGARDHPDSFIMLATNLTDPLIILSFGIFLVVPLILSFTGWKHHTQFIRRGLIFSVFFLCFYFVLGLFHEMRLFFPILPLVILAVISSLRGWFEPNPHKL